MNTVFRSLSSSRGGGCVGVLGVCVPLMLTGCGTSAPREDAVDSPSTVPYVQRTQAEEEKMRDYVRHVWEMRGFEVVFDDEHIDGKLPYPNVDAPVDGGGLPAALSEALEVYHTGVVESVPTGAFYEIVTGRVDDESCVDYGYGLLVRSAKVYPGHGVYVHGDCVYRDAEGGLTGEVAGSYSCELAKGRAKPDFERRDVAAYCRPL